MRLNILLVVVVLCWSSAKCLQTAEVSLKFLNDNEFRLDVTIGSNRKRFRLVKKNANVPTMFAEDNGLISNLQSQVSKSQTSFNRTFLKSNLVQTIKLNFTNSINYRSFVCRLTRCTKILTGAHL